VILLISDAAQANDYKTKIGPPRTPHPKPCAAPAVPAGAAPAASRRGAAYLLAGRGGVQSRFSRRARRSASPTASSSATWSAAAAAAPRAPRPAPPPSSEACDYTHCGGKRTCRNT
jgi:hypothetical protein